MADGMDGAATVLPLLLGRYRVEGMLGEGGLGTVVKAYDTRLKRMVAIKTLKHSLAADVDLYRHMKERFVREAEAGSRMGGNPHVVTVHDLATDDGGTLYLIQEFVPGGSVADRIARGPLPVAEALAIAADAAEGLQAAHEKGIVHRDIKPANLFLAEDGRALVGDFGIAQVDDVSARTHAATGHPGTPLYMSPEQQQQSLYVRPASDQYSLGLVLFEMLTGVGYRRVGVRAATTLLAAQPEAVAALVARMIEGHPDDRFPAMAAVMKEAERIARELASRTTKPTTARIDDGALMQTTTLDHDGAPISPADAAAPEGTTQRRTPVIPPRSIAYVGSAAARVPPSSPIGRQRALVIGLAVVLLATALGGGGFVLSRGGGAGVSATATFPTVGLVTPVVQPLAASAATAPTPVPAATPTSPPATSPPIDSATVSGPATAAAMAAPSSTAASPPTVPPAAMAIPAPTATPPPPVPTATPATTTFFVANTDGTGVNMREGPSDQTRIVALVPEGAQVSATGAPISSDHPPSSTYYAVRAGDNSGYVRADFLVTAAAPTAPATQGTPDFTPFAKGWGRKGFGLTIAKSGEAQATWRVGGICGANEQPPSCDAIDSNHGIVPSGKGVIRFTRIVGTTAFGVVVSSNMPGQLRTGDAVSLTILPNNAAKFDAGNGQVWDFTGNP